MSGGVWARVCAFHLLHAAESNRMWLVALKTLGQAAQAPLCGGVL